MWKGSETMYLCANLMVLMVFLHLFWHLNLKKKKSIRKRQTTANKATATKSFKWLIDKQLLIPDKLLMWSRSTKIQTEDIILLLTIETKHSNDAFAVDW